MDEDGVGGGTVDLELDNNSLDEVGEVGIRQSLLEEMVVEGMNGADGGKRRGCYGGIEGKNIQEK